MPALDHPLERINSFNNKYVFHKSYHNPDALDFMFRYGMGEFSASADIAFEKYLACLKQHGSNSYNAI